MNDDDDAAAAAVMNTTCMYGISIIHTERKYAHKTKRHQDICFAKLERRVQYDQNHICVAMSSRGYDISNG